MNVLVTGAGGYCGQHVVSRLLEAGHTVWGVTRRPLENTKFTSNKNFRSVVTDLIAPKGLPEDVDAVIHTAASLGIPGVEPADINRNNIDAMTPLLDYCLNANTKKFVFFSAMSVYGTVTVTEVDEQTPPNEPDVYGQSKLTGEQMLFEDRKEMPSVSLRLPAVIGPGSVLGWLDRVRIKLANDDDVTFMNPENPFNNAVHIKELANFICAILDRRITGAETYTLGAGNPMPVGEMLAIMARNLGSKSQLIGKTDPSAAGFIINSSKAQRSLGWQPSSMSDLVDRYLDENSGEARQ